MFLVGISAKGGKAYSSNNTTTVLTQNDKFFLNGFLVLFNQRKRKQQKFSQAKHTVLVEVKEMDYI